MTETVITSPKREVRVGPNRPFAIIGERINPSGRAKLAAEMAAGDFQRVRADALAQVEAGAHLLDVNAGIPMADEPSILAEAIRIVQATVEVPLAIDSSVVKALEAGLAAYQGKPLVNSVTGEEDRLEAVLPLVAQYHSAVIGIANDETGISEDPDVRFAIARKIVERAERYGIPRSDVIIDPLAMPIGAVRLAGVTLFQLTRRLREELGVNVSCGASNISFGLPERPTLNSTFLAMAIASGATAAIVNPLDEGVRKTVLAADVLMGRDEDCRVWLRAHRGEGPEGVTGRRARRERRMARDGG